MKRLIIYFILFHWVLNSFGQEFGAHWISYPFPNDSSEVFFRHIYITKERPRQASINIICNGKFKLYINERNISRSLMIDGMDKDTLLAQTFNVSQYLRADSNIIAVWYAPNSGSFIGKQLSLDYYGIDAKGKPFYHKADGEWLCQLVPGCYTNDDKEVFNAKAFIKDWNSTEYIPATWLHPTGSFSNNSMSLKERTLCPTQYGLSKIIYPINTYADSLGYHIDFGRSFFGAIRLTFRGAKRGTSININDYQYICNGEMDEQAFCRFRFNHQRTYLLSGDKYFKQKDITNIEGLELTFPL